MFTHLFKLIWNKKRQNLLLIIEIFVSFFVLFIILSFLSYAYDNYKSPLNFNPDNVKLISIRTDGGPSLYSDSMAQYHAALDQDLHAISEINGVSYADFITPFSMGSHAGGVMYGKRSEMTEFINADENYAKLMEMPLVRGRWFDKTDIDTVKPPVVINEDLAYKFFHNEDPVGKILTVTFDKEYSWKIIGVAKNTKSKSDYLKPEAIVYTNMGENGKKVSQNILVRINPNAPGDIDNKITKAINNVIKLASVEIVPLNENRKNKNLVLLVPAIIFIVICGFLIFNVCLGLFGVLWYNINKRKSEIGLRKAIGASSGSVMFHFVGEAFVLATLSIILGLFFAIQFPILRVLDIAPAVYIKGIISSILFIYFIVLLCAIYPSRQAAAVYPAQVLHEE